MSVVGDLFERLRQTILLDHRLGELTTEVRDLKSLHADTRERLIRIEGVIEGAQRASERKRLR